MLQSEKIIEVREATEGEFPIVHQIMLAAFEEYRGLIEPPSGALSETVDDVRQSAADGAALIAFLNGEPVGSARYACRSDHLYCSRISVLPSARGQGLATAILAHIHVIAKDLGYGEVRLSTREVMESNQKLYLKLGYSIVAREPHPQGEGIVLVLAKRI